MMNINQVMENAKELSAKDKALVAHCLIASLESRQDTGVDEAWGELAARRFDEMVAGRVDAASWAEIKSAAKG